MGISWLFAHIYELHQHREESYPHTICLKHKVFWWKKFEVKYVEDRFSKWKILGYVSKPIAKTGPSQPPLKTPEKKTSQLSTPSSSASKQEKLKYKKQLLEALSSLGSDSDEEEAVSSQINCYALQMAQDPAENEDFGFDSP